MSHKTNYNTSLGEHFKSIMARKFVAFKEESALASASPLAAPQFLHFVRSLQLRF